MLIRSNFRPEKIKKLKFGVLALRLSEFEKLLYEIFCCKQVLKNLSPLGRFQFWFVVDYENTSVCIFLITQS